MSSCQRPDGNGQRPSGPPSGKTRDQLWSPSSDRSRLLDTDASIFSIRYIMYISTARNSSCSSSWLVMILHEFDFTCNLTYLGALSVEDYHLCHALGVGVPELLGLEVACSHDTYTSYWSIHLVEAGLSSHVSPVPGSWYTPITVWADALVVPVWESTTSTTSWPPPSRLEHPPIL